MSVAMHRCLISPVQWSHPEIVLAEEEARHLRCVLRARVGDVVILMDGQGYTAQAVIQSCSPAGVRLQLRADSRAYTPPAAVSLILIQALPKHAAMDWIIQKACELGVEAIWPLRSDRVISRAARPEALAGRLARWRKIARESIKQSGAAWLPTIEPLQSLSSILPRLSALTLCLVASLQARARPLGEVLGQLRLGRPARVGLVIGPEGDLSAAESLALQESGACLVRFGPNVLRVETAALYGLSILQYELNAAHQAAALSPPTQAPAR